MLASAGSASQHHELTREQGLVVAGAGGERKGVWAPDMGEGLAS